jgi:uncharacterized protein with ParB-like and HNH nuclease domain
LSGIEHEEEERFTDPFDPEEISIDTKPVPMETCLRRLKQKTIVLNPDFQRNEVWDDIRKSQLIESLMLKIPLPMFYVSADEKNNYTVVDGLQRLSTIRSFILGDEYLKNPDEAIEGNGFKLQGLEFWKDYESKNFNELPSNIQNRILETVFTFTVINPGTPEEVRRNIFNRINKGGLPLSSQEIRNALYIGHSTKLLKELSQYSEFLDSTSSSIKSLRMEDRELILRFLAFLIRDYTTYTRTIGIDSFLSDTMIVINALPNLDSNEFKRILAKDKEKRIKIEDINCLSLDKIRELFKSGMTRARILFGKHTFRKSFGNNPRSSINKSLFEMWGVLLAKLSEQSFQKLHNNSEALIYEYSILLTTGRFHLDISRDSMKAPSVKTRFEEIQKLINKNIHD